VADRLAALTWPPGVEVEDLSFGPIALVHRLQEVAPYDRMVLVSSVERGRTPGHVYRYAWEGGLPSADEIQARVGEAVTGVISLDNLLVVCGHFGVLPDDVVLVEVEPVVEDWGPDFTPEVEASLDQVETLVREAALMPVARSTAAAVER
jgi:hydrogenase maturation protease